MTALSQTFYSLALFSALISLWQWIKRRRRVSNSIKRAVQSMARETDA